jgi:N-methylhydantoinase B
MNAAHPAAVNGRTSTCQRAADLVIGALAQAAPERCIAAGNGSCATASFAGIDPEDGHLWVYLETIGGGSGARAHKDGLDGVHVHMTNTSNLPVEALEVEYPLTVLRYGWWTARAVPAGPAVTWDYDGCTVPKRNVICGSTARAC